MARTTKRLLKGFDDHTLLRWLIQMSRDRFDQKVTVKPTLADAELTIEEVLTRMGAGSINCHFCGSQTRKAPFCSFCGKQMVSLSETTVSPSETAGSPRSRLAPDWTGQTASAAGASQATAGRSHT